MNIIENGNGFWKKKGNPASCDNMDGPGRYTKWNKSVTEGQFTAWIHLFEILNTQKDRIKFWFAEAGVVGNG